MYQCEKHFSPIHCCPLTHSLPPSLTHIHSLTHSHTSTHSHTHPLTPSLTHSLTHIHSLTHTHIHSLTHTHSPPSLTLSLTHLLTHTSTHSLPHTLTHPLTLSLSPHSLTTSVRTLPQVANHRVCTYSGGMKRRLSVALAYIGDPQILFLGKTPLPLLSTILSPPPQMSPLQEWM